VDYPATTRNLPLSALQDLIAQISDSRLRERLTAEWAKAVQDRKFGLVFENHLPELLPLYGVAPRRGDWVCRKSGPLQELWQVRAVRDGVATCIKPQDDAHPNAPNVSASALVNFPVNELLVVRQFGEPIFPALTPVDAVANGPLNAPWHMLIEADNYHALQLLNYLYAGQVDCIYIDPPYNTGARDWKYNNDYVDGNDGWRHSRWLAMMQRRLLLARRLLKPDGVMIITIDDWEVNTLGLLLSSIFPDLIFGTVIIKYNPSGTTRNSFLRVHEYAYFIMALGTELDMREAKLDVRVRNLRRNGNNSARFNRKTMSYPIFIDKIDLKILGVGEMPSEDFHPSAQAIEKEYFYEVWPIDDHNNEKCWYYSSDRVKNHGNEEIFFRWNKSRLHPYFRTNNQAKSKYTTVWDGSEFDAAAHGSNLIKSIIKHDNFPYPKSLYAVKECLKTVVNSRKNALIVDFFAGSGTTLNAVNLLNAADGGQRRCILVTNNEVSAEEAETLRTRGLQPGDADWEALGICRSVTWPRSKFTIVGQRDDGTALPGEYLTGKTVEKEKARNFTPIGFVDPATLDTPARKKQVVALINGLPQTLVKDPCPFIVSEDHNASILFDTAAAEDWLEALAEQDHITDFYIVTPAKKTFDGLKAQVMERLGPLRVSEDEKRPMRAGFPANLAYFKLDFLDKDRIALKRAFREILPLLWLKAGAIGPRPELPPNAPEPPVFIPKGTNFAVLLDESWLAKLLRELQKRPSPPTPLPEGERGISLSHVFIVTDADESFKVMAAEVIETLSNHHPGLQVVQLYRDYLVNFMINQRQDAQGAPG
jgi:adenine-specific DNA-methyltransferase